MIYATTVIFRITFSKVDKDAKENKQVNCSRVRAIKGIKAYGMVSVSGGEPFVYTWTLSPAGRLAQDDKPKLGSPTVA